MSAVAFYGYLSKSSAHNLSPHHTIVYDTMVINRDNRYNQGDGIFIAPVTGVYAFHFSVCVWLKVQNLHGPVLKLLSMGIFLDLSLKNLWCMEEMVFTAVAH